MNRLVDEPLTFNWIKALSVPDAQVNQCMSYVKAKWSDISTLGVDVSEVVGIAYYAISVGEAFAIPKGILNEMSAGRVPFADINKFIKSKSGAGPTSSMEVTPSVPTFTIMGEGDFNSTLNGKPLCNLVVWITRDYAVSLTAQLNVDPKFIPDVFVKLMPMILSSISVNEKSSQVTTDPITFPNVDGNYETRSFTTLAIQKMFGGRLMANLGVGLDDKKMRKMIHKISACFAASDDNLRSAMGASPTTEMGAALLSARAGSSVRGSARASMVSAQGALGVLSGIHQNYLTTQTGQVGFRNEKNSLSQKKSEKQANKALAETRMKVKVGTLRQRYDPGSPISVALSKYNSDLEPDEESALYMALCQACLKVPPLETLPIFPSPICFIRNECIDYVKGLPVPCVDEEACRVFNVMTEHSDNFQEGVNSAVLEAMRVLRICKMNRHTACMSLCMDIPEGFISSNYKTKIAGNIHDFTLGGPVRSVKIEQFIPRRRGKTSKAMASTSTVRMTTYDCVVNVKMTIDMSIANSYQPGGGSTLELNEAIAKLGTVKNTFSMEGSEPTKIVDKPPFITEGSLDGPLIVVTPEIRKRKHDDWEERKKKRTSEGRERVKARVKNIERPVA